MSFPVLQTFRLALEFAVCKLGGMNAAALYERLRGMGVSSPYASQISRGIRAPSLALALRIHREIGAKLGPLVGATKAEISALERVAERAA